MPETRPWRLRSSNVSSNAALANTARGDRFLGLSVPQVRQRAGPVPHVVATRMHGAAAVALQRSAPAGIADPGDAVPAQTASAAERQAVFATYLAQRIREQLEPGRCLGASDRGQGICNRERTLLYTLAASLGCGTGASPSWPP